MNKSRWDNTHYKLFAASLEEVICKRNNSEEENIAQQKCQIETLCNYEKGFRDTLISSIEGREAYTDFIKYVRDERKNILAARPYFRERQEIFKSRIAPALRNRSEDELSKFNINYSFISFVMGLGRFGEETQVYKIAQNVKDIRNELIQTNIPMAISRARAFVRHSQQHLEYMDLIQIATEGLIAAIDKFVLPYNDSFGGVLYGRVTGDLIEANSETLIHFYPKDKRLIYNANKFVKSGKTFEEIAKYLNEEFSKDGKSVNLTDAHELQQLHVASYTVSGDSTGESDDSHEDKNPINRFEADNNWRPDVSLEETEALGVVKKMISKLSLFERKFLALKGINNDSFLQ